MTPAPVVGGMVRPPWHHRRLIELTACFVARHGSEFEKRMLPYSPSIARCDFLDPSHPYHAYYQRCLSQLRSNPAGPAMDARMTNGIHQPPRYVRKVIEFTATSVVKYGLHHEKWITEVFGDHPTHKFLVPSHPYHAYYLQQIADARALLCSSKR
ncbi:hypothetical protein COCNU_08G006030 [Cocos nucifera]|uniref:SURP motif domain-containing protein n=1 Tax=Cocos nucifera TaxID=13894 RepID=A0A8K0N6R4_COCNU|nr:hypothetical protein COCNU_08G006030 [Cocos nucifera]